MRVRHAACLPVVLRELGVERRGEYRQKYLQGSCGGSHFDCRIRSVLRHCRAVDFHDRQPRGDTEQTELGDFRNRGTHGASGHRHAVRLRAQAAGSSSEQGRDEPAAAVYFSVRRFVCGGFAGLHRPAVFRHGRGFF